MIEHYLAIVLAGMLGSAISWFAIEFAIGYRERKNNYRKMKDRHDKHFERVMRDLDREE